MEGGKKMDTLIKNSYIITGDIHKKVIENGDIMIKDKRRESN